MCYVGEQKRNIEGGGAKMGLKNKNKKIFMEMKKRAAERDAKKDFR
jgi:hypothetical protein